MENWKYWTQNINAMKKEFLLIATLSLTQLAVEAQQIGADHDFVTRVLHEEWEQLAGAMPSTAKEALRQQG